MSLESVTHLPGIQLSDLKGMGGLISHNGFVGMPPFVLTDPHGKVLAKWTGYGEGIIELQLKSAGINKNDCENK